MKRIVYIRFIFGAIIRSVNERFKTCNSVVIVITNKEKIIGAYEEKLAYAIADKLLDKPEFSILMVLFPFLLLPFFQRCQAHKKNRDLFIRHWLYTKRLALSAAANRLYNGVGNEATDQDVIMLVTRGETVEDETLQEIHAAQIKEVSLLITHYHQLLDTQSEEYDGMVRETYSKQTWKSFISELAAVEKLVGDKAKQIYPNEPDSVNEMSRMLVQQTEILRNQESERIFSGE